jgi:hypothetical protein
MKTNQYAHQTWPVLAFVALFLRLSSLSVAQTTAAVPYEPTYTLWEYIKVLPGKEGDYLKVEQTWKKVHQRRKDEGKIINWTFYRRVLPSGSNATYDYATTTTFKSGAELEGAMGMTWEYIKEGLSKEETTIAEGTEKTRNIVDRRLNLLLERVEPQGRYVKFTTLKVKPGMGAEQEKLERMMNPVFVEACKTGKIASWRFGRQLFPISEGGGNYYRGIGTKTMDDLVKNETNKYVEAAFKKVYPTKDYAVVSKSFRDMMTVVMVEIWEKVDTTQ